MCFCTSPHRPSRLVHQKCTRKTLEMPKRSLGTLSTSKEAKAKIYKEVCPSCGELFQNLALHLKRNAWCQKEVQEAIEKEAGATSTSKGVKVWDVHHQLFKKKVRKMIAKDRQVLHEDMHVSKSHADAAYLAFIQWTTCLIDEVIRACKDEKKPLEAVTSIHQTYAEILQEFKSWDRVESFMSRELHYPYIEPRSRTLQDESHGGERRELAELQVSALLERLIQDDPNVRECILKTSALWKTGELHAVQPKMMCDITDGAVFRHHPHLARKATDSEMNDVRVALYEYTDEFTTTNPIGTKRGDHKYSTHLSAIANLPIEKRFNSAYIMPHTIAQYKTIKKAGIHQVLCGMSHDGSTILDSDCFAGDMRKLAEGIRIHIPNDEEGGYR